MINYKIFLTIIFFQISDIRQAKGTTCTVKTKTISIGLKFDFSENGHYVQIKSNSGGGVFPLVLDEKKTYTVQSIIDLAIPLFKSSKATSLIKYSTHKLAIGNNLEVSSFCDNEGKEIGLIDYFMLFDLWKTRKTLYILCDPTEQYWDRSKNPDDPDESDDMNENEKENDSSYDQEKDNSINNNLDNGFDETKGSDSNLDTKKSNSKNSSSLEKNLEVLRPSSKCNRGEVQRKSPKKLNNSLSDDLISNQNTISTVQEIVELPPLEDQPEKKENDQEFLLMATRVGDFFKNVVKKIEISYWVTGFSKYTPHQFFHSENLKSAIYQRIISRLDDYSGPDPDFDKFDPQMFGYPISKIKVDNYVLLETSINEAQKLTFQFPNAKDKASVELHEIMFDLDFVVGSNDGKWSIGVVPFCFETCQPSFTWYKDDMIYEEGDRLYYLTNLPLTEEPTQWQCKITCNNDFAYTSKKIWLKISSIPYDPDELQGIREVQKTAFTVNKLQPIGSGQQATVYKGQLDSDIVAVKVIKTYGKVTQDLRNEICVLNALNHPNFVCLKAVCVEKNTISLLLDYFDGITLSLLLDDEDLQKMYCFREKKKKIILQLASAVKFLQTRRNPIIHRDLKPENIMVNSRCEIKICDFGISKFTIMQTNLRSTIGRRQVGTPAYMAPEIAVDKEPASLSSDIWAVGIIILEIFKEDSAWDLEDPSEHAKKLRDREKCDLSFVPANLKDVVAQCLSYEKEKRPTAAQLYQALKEAYNK